ncbi:hypothetical protein JY651_50305 [Pyxidicoccus parkwayensis]|uniref:Lipoprotein n=1 Tax=Pyxidicoccus parkwayensis TaxID=2813578 RepID=A0ABX7NXK2_9BACT|nr:hypothetical protein [Pyxidicoccus parkwaysis]QSQ23188.1 hypothetical protein JY651_50305 [Pyxidicoccus parkwaysis]
MSYLSLPRLTFSGLFEGDVNTVNNDVRNYSSSTFEPRFQEAWVQHPDGKTTYNGWWNPDGGNTFRLLDCAVSGAVGPDGAAAGDVALSLRIATQTARTAAKLVDLDPQYQFASGIWGLRLELTDGKRTLMAGTFQPACFRDVYFGRLTDKVTGQPVGGSPGASARFTGVLTELVWHEGAAASPVLAAFKASAEKNQGRLSLSLMTYGYSKSRGTTDFTFGRVLGTLAPWFSGEPLTFAPGRRFSPSIADAASGPPSASQYNIGYLNAAFAPGNTSLVVDFGMSLPLWLLPSGDKNIVDGQRIVPQDLGPIRVVVLTRADTVGADGTISTPIMEGAAVADSDYVVIGTLTDYGGAWLASTGGVVNMAVPEAARALVGDHPLALLIQVKGAWTVGIRESNGGQWARADDFVQRLDAPVKGWASSTVTLHAMRYGAPFAGASLAVSLSAPDDTSGGAGPDEVKPPQVKIPKINVPADTVRFDASLTADDRGVAVLTYYAADPGNPREYIDGQIYEINYALAGGGQSPLPMFEQVAVHVRDGFDPPATPSWETDVAPVLVQYGNLYPIMSRGLFSFSDYNTVVQHARLLYLAFTRPPEDPNYMPATRDLSAGKLRMIVNWLATFLPGAPGDYGALPVAKVGATLEPSAPPPVLGDVAVRRGSPGLRKAIRSMGHGTPVPPGVKA